MQRILHKFVGFEQAPTPAQWGLCLVFVLLTFGGWNESAYISAELKGGPRTMVWVILSSMVTLTVIYLLLSKSHSCLHVAHCKWRCGLANFACQRKNAGTSKQANLSTSKPIFLILMKRWLKPFI